MELILFVSALIGIILLYPLLRFIPGPFSGRGKRTVFLVSIGLTVIGLLAQTVMPLWQVCFFLLLLVFTSTYLLMKNSNSLLAAGPTGRDNEEEWNELAASTNSIDPAESIELLEESLQDMSNLSTSVSNQNKQEEKISEDAIAMEELTMLFDKELEPGIKSQAVIVQPVLSVEEMEVLFEKGVSLDEQNEPAEDIKEFDIEETTFQYKEEFLSNEQSEQLSAEESFVPERDSAGLEDSLIDETVIEQENGLGRKELIEEEQELIERLDNTSFPEPKQLEDDLYVEEISEELFYDNSWLNELVEDEEAEQNEDIFEQRSMELELSREETASGTEVSNKSDMNDEDKDQNGAAAAFDETELAELFNMLEDEKPHFQEQETEGGNSADTFIDAADAIGESDLPATEIETDNEHDIDLLAQSDSDLDSLLVSLKGGKEENEDAFVQTEIIKESHPNEEKTAEIINKETNSMVNGFDEAEEESTGLVEGNHVDEEQIEEQAKEIEYDKDSTEHGDSLETLILIKENQSYLLEDGGSDGSSGNEEHHEVKEKADGINETASVELDDHHSVEEADLLKILSLEEGNNEILENKGRQDNEEKLEESPSLLDNVYENVETAHDEGEFSGLHETEQEKGEEGGSYRLKQQLFNIMIEQLELAHVIYAADEYEELLREHLYDGLPPHEYYILAKMLMTHYAETEQHESFEILLEELRNKYSSYPVLMQELEYLEK